MEKVLITGADGFIGKNLVNFLLNEHVVIFAIVYPGHNIYEGFENEQLHVYSINLENVLEYISEFPNDIDVMYHLAWNGVQPELRNDMDVQMKNIDIAINCMKLATALKIKKVIYPGSTNEYLYYNKPISKEASPSPSNAYGATKVAIRYLCSDFASRNNIDFVYTIITGIYAEDRRDSNVIFYTIEKLLKREKPLLTKLEQLWDYVHIEDVIAALIAIGKKGRAGGVYTIGYGDNWALSNYIEIIHRKIDSTLPLGIGDVPYASDKLPSSCVDLTDLINDTGFVPKVGFEEGITRVINKIRIDMEIN